MWTWRHYSLCFIVNILKQQDEYQVSMICFREKNPVSNKQKNVCIWLKVHHKSVKNWKPNNTHTEQAERLSYQERYFQICIQIADDENTVTWVTLKQPGNSAPFSAPTCSLTVTCNLIWLWGGHLKTKTHIDWSIVMSIIIYHACD